MSVGINAPVKNTPVAFLRHLTKCPAFCRDNFAAQVNMKFFSGLFISLLLSIGTLNAQHLKKDGTPDMRYKENKTTYYAPSHSTSSSTWSYTSGTHHRKSYNYSVPRDSHGRIKRSESARHTFMKQTGYPHGRKGYVIDHIIPLKEGGCDCPANMQWQTIQDAKAKDKWE